MKRIKFTYAIILVAIVSFLADCNNHSRNKSPVLVKNFNSQTINEEVLKVLDRFIDKYNKHSWNFDLWVFNINQDLTAIAFITRKHACPVKPSFYFIHRDKKIFVYSSIDKVFLPIDGIEIPKNSFSSNIEAEWYLILYTQYSDKNMPKDTILSLDTSGAKIPFGGLKKLINIPPNI